MQRLYPRPESVPFLMSVLVPVLSALSRPATFHGKKREPNPRENCATSDLQGHYSQCLHLQPYQPALSSNVDSPTSQVEIVWVFRTAEVATFTRKDAWVLRMGPGMVVR